jgi:hypothetical protein
LNEGFGSAGIKLAKGPACFLEHSLRRSASNKNHLKGLGTAVLETVQLRIDEGGENQAALASKRWTQEPQHSASVRFVRMSEDGEELNEIKVPGHG